MVKKLVAEGIGTYILVFTVGQTVLAPGAGDLAPIAIGFALAVMVYATGHISGGHLNPAVTLGVFLRGKATGAELFSYWLAQIIAAVVASLGVLFLKADGAPGMLPTAVGPALLAEFIFTGALVFVVLNVATARDTAGNSYFGLAIGGTLMVGAFAVGNISGAALNPAVAIGLALMNIIEPGSLWIYLVANFAGGAAAAVLFNGFGFAGDKPTTATAAEKAEARPAGTPQ
jgi:aquaporin Z